jgi:chromosome segregation ATPase
MAEPTKEQLQLQINQLTTDLTATKQDLATANLELQGQRDAVTAANAEKAELQAQLTDERDRSGDVAGELNEAQNLIEELQTRLAKADAIRALGDSAIVSDGTDHYKVLAPKFKYKHVEYTADDLKDNEALVQELVAAGVGFLQKAEPKNEK